MTLLSCNEIANDSRLSSGTWNRRLYSLFHFFAEYLTLADAPDIHCEYDQNYSTLPLNSISLILSPNYPPAGNENASFFVYNDHILQAKGRKLHVEYTTRIFNKKPIHGGTIFYLESVLGL